MVHRTQVAPLPQPGSTNVLLMYYCFTQSFHRWKTSYPFYFYPLHFMSPKYLEAILNFPFSSSLPFSISPSPDTTGSSWANAALSNSPKQHPPWGHNFLLLFPDLPPVSMYPSWLLGHQQQYLVLFVGQQQGHRGKKGLPAPWDHIFVVPLSQKLCCPASLLFQVAQVPQSVSLPESSWGLHPKEGTHILSAFPGTLAALAQTGKIRSEGYLQCLPSVPFPILLPKDTVGPISVPIKKLHLVPWGDRNGD